MPSKYTDPTATMQTIGCIYNDPSILDRDDIYVITDEDFVDDFHRVVYGAIYKLHEMGAQKITINTIIDFLETRPKSKGIFNANKGVEYLSQVSMIADPEQFPYYYNHLKKMSLLRAYDNIGIDMTGYYDPENIFDQKKAQKQREWLDNISLEEIAQTVQEKLDKVNLSYVNNDGFGRAVLAGDGIEELIKQFEEQPDVGVPLYGNFINTITRGARLGKFYLRSAPTGCGN